MRSVRKCTYCSATAVQHLPGSGKGPRILATELTANPLLRAGRPADRQAAHRADRRSGAARSSVRTGGGAEAEDLDRPVTMATARAAELRKGIRADVAALTGKLAELAEQLDRGWRPRGS